MEPEATENTTFAVRMPVELRDKLDAVAPGQFRTRNNLILVACDQFLKFLESGTIDAQTIVPIEKQKQPEPLAAAS